MSPFKYLYSIDHFTLSRLFSHSNRGASARAKESLIGKRKWETYPDPIHAREIGHDDSVHPTVRMDWQEVLSRFCMAGGGESKLCSLCLSWRNISQFT